MKRKANLKTQIQKLQMIELVDKNVKTAIINIFCMFKKVKHREIEMEKNIMVEISNRLCS